MIFRLARGLYAAESHKIPCPEAILCKRMNGMAAAHRKNRKSNKILAVLACLGVCLATVPPAAGAEAGEARTENGIEVIVVTARKRAQTIDEVPASLSVFSPDEIEERGIRDMVDLGKFVPNLHISTFSAGNPAGANPVLRGIGIQDHLILTDPGVGVYVDGVYLGRQIGQHWSLSNIERVEVLRGPQGTLLGRNSIGGAINIVTRTPHLEPEARMAVEAGTRERANLDLYGNIPLGHTAAVSFSGALKRRGGIGDFVNLPGAGWGVGELRDRSGRLTLLWRPADSLSLLLAADATSGRNGMNPYTTLIDELPGGSLFRTGLRNADVSPNPYDNFSGEADLVEKSHQAHGWSLTTEWEANPGLTVKGIASRRSSDYRGGLDDDSTVIDFMSFPEIGEAGQTSLELQISGERDALDFVAGLWAFREDGFNLQPDAVFAGGPTTFHVLQDTESEAVYASIGYRPAPAVRISAGLRHTEDFKDARAVLNDFVDARARRDWREWNWDLAATWQLRGQASVFASIANGYQAGQFPPRPYCLFGFIDVSRPGNVSVPNCFAAGDHITAVNHEIGFRGNLGERLRVSAALFLTNYDNLPLSASDTSGAGFDTRNVIVGQRSVGIEWESRLELHSRFSIDMRIGYLDSAPEAEGIVPLLSPRWTVSASPEWMFPLPEGNLALRADYSWRDSMYGEPAANRRPWSELPARELLNFDISYRPADSNWLFALYGRNVFDERYAHATLNTGDYILRILSNDASEFGLRAAVEW